MTLAELCDVVHVVLLEQMQAYLLARVAAGGDADLDRLRTVLDDLLTDVPAPLTPEERDLAELKQQLGLAS